VETLRCIAQVSGSSRGKIQILFTQAIGSKLKAAGVKVKQYNWIMFIDVNLRIPKEVIFAYSVLSSDARKKLWISGVALCLIGILDLAGIALLAVIATVTLGAVNNKSISNNLENYLSLIGLSGDSIHRTVVILSILMVFLFTIRSVVSIFLTNKIFQFLAHQSNALTSKFLTKLLNQDLSNLQRNTSQEILFGLTNGLNASVVGLNGLIITTGADIFLSVIMIVGLVIYNPFIAISSILIFFSIAFLTHLFLNARIISISQKSTKANIKANMKILEVLDTYRESFVRNTRQNYISNITKLRAEVSESIAAQTILPNISKYSMELTVILGAVAMAAVQFIFFDANQAIAGISLFAAVGFRISPAFLRVQQNIMSLRVNQAWANETMKIFSGMPDGPSRCLKSNELASSDAFSPKINVKNVSFNYGSKSDFNLNELNIEIPTGSFVAIVGSSGSGKTTFIDLILGLLEPTTGEITISGQSPNTINKKWPGVVAYVPQDVVVINDTVIENVGLGFESNSIDEGKIRQCLRMAHLEEVIENLPQKLNEKLGEKGSRLSGGQRQRIGIARALYTNPKILVLDEATSSLDSESEREINKSLSELKGKLTLIVIAHRLPSVINADLVVYFENGQIEAAGTFEEVRRKSAKFNNQALLMGL